MDEQSERRRVSTGVVIFKYWHVFMVLLVQIAGLAYMYGRLSQNVEDLARRLDQAESRTTPQVTREEFNDFRGEIRDDIKGLHSAILSMGGRR